MSHPNLIKFVTENQEVLIQTDFMREIFMIPDRLQASSKVGDNFTISTESPIYQHKLFVYEGNFYSIDSFIRTDVNASDIKTYNVTAKNIGVSFDVRNNNALATPQDKFILESGIIRNYPEGSSIETTLGIFIANYLFFVFPFDSKISYLNEEITASKMESRISLLLANGEVDASVVKNKYSDTLSLFGQSNEIICANITEKTISIPKEISDLRERLISENREALEAGDASVMSDIEQTLIKKYREYLEGDPSLHFLLKKKYFDVTLKKLFLVQGMTEIFGQPGKFKFIDNPMGNGWRKKDLTYIFNEVRQGSFSRGVETQNGGVIAKLILRVLQDTNITEDDCGTKRGESIFGTKDELKDFIWNYVIEPNGSLTLITDKTIDDFVGRNLSVRTPGYCQSKTGFCSTCFGYMFKKLDQKAFAPVANDFARAQVVASLKRMHGTSHSTVDISDINKYLV